MTIQNLGTYLNGYISKFCRYQDGFVCVFHSVMRKENFPIWKYYTTGPYKNLLCVFSQLDFLGGLQLRHKILHFFMKL